MHPGLGETGLHRLRSLIGDRPQSSHSVADPLVERQGVVFDEGLGTEEVGLGAARMDSQVAFHGRMDLAPQPMLGPEPGLAQPTLAPQNPSTGQGKQEPADPHCQLRQREPARARPRASTLVPFPKVRFR